MPDVHVICARIDEIEPALDRLRAHVGTLASQLDALEGQLASGDVGETGGGGGGDDGVRSQRASDAAAACDDDAALHAAKAPPLPPPSRAPQLLERLARDELTLVASHLPESDRFAAALTCRQLCAAVVASRGRLPSGALFETPTRALFASRALLEWGVLTAGAPRTPRLTALAATPTAA
ncbi:hypothetical protein KFE25_011621 [Diacronema lutheri]|uniref:Uncharacterized protein n=1 Tax=Diacronema lutheri TaxID=2081491 RepID=A0A8J6C8R7_DIALT|nr:hypothetical protein KFE25_011621 [Diacronema lutheri]